MNRLQPLIVSTLVVLMACGGGGGGGNDAPIFNDGPVVIDGPGATVDAGIDAGIDAVPAGPPLLRYPVTLTDAELASQAAALLGEGGSKNCDRCHAISRDRLRSWGTLSNAAVTRCLGDTMPTTQPAAQTIVDCFRDVPAEPTSAWHPQALGVYATAAYLPWFEYVFTTAYPTTGAAELAAFQDQVAMPRSDTGRLTQGEFDVVAEWFARGLPQLDAVIPADPPVTTCQTNITPDVASHVTAMATQGWRAGNLEAGILMHGCGAASGRACLTGYNESAVNPWSMGWTATMPDTVLRLLYEYDYSSSYWTRSSADGRFVSHGGARTASSTYRSTIIDLAWSREVPAAALYDPGFFPDNSGFALQGGSAKFCEQSLLLGLPTMVSFTEPQCRTTNAVGLYQHLGAARGGDYWTVDGQFTNDNGGHNVTSSDPSSGFGSTASIDLVPLVHTGSQFVPQAAIRKMLPREGDVVLSPTAKLLVSRVNGSFVLRKVVATPSGGSYLIDVPEIARYCLRGGKPGLSFDDRWMTYHHYVEAGDWAELGYASADDPGFVALRASGAANIYLVDLRIGTRMRVTTMNPGQYALYPYFRSDGWIYFIVRDNNRGVENIVASDAALALEP